MFVVIFLGSVLWLSLIDLHFYSHDIGFYLYDARLATDGLIPYVDYPTRSPLFHYFLSIIFLLNLDPLLSAMVLNVMLVIIGGILIYFVAKEIHTRNAGIAAASFWMFTPFTFSTSFKDQHLAIPIILFALYLFMKEIDQPQFKPKTYSLIGVLLGLAFLSRQIAGAYAVSFVAFAFYYRQLQFGDSPSTPLKITVAMAIPALATTVLCYAIITGGELGSIAVFVREHLLYNLFSDSMAGGSLLAPPDYLATPRKGRLLLGRTIPVMIVPLLFLPAYLRFSSRQLLSRGLIFVTLGGMGVWTVVIYLMSVRGFWHLEPWFGIVFGGVSIVAVFGILRMAPSDIYTATLGKGMVLVFLIILPILAHVLLNVNFPLNRDILPWIIILASISAAEIYSNSGKVSIQITTTILLVAFLGSLLVFSPVLTPAFVGTTTEDGHTLRVSTTNAVADDLQQRTDADQTVFSAQPIYALQADRRNTADFSRVYWHFRGSMESDFRIEMETELLSSIGTEDVPYVIVDHRTERLFAVFPELEEQIYANYCPVDDQSLYDSVDAVLYERSEAAPACG
jgi:hypothetical protein